MVEKQFSAEHEIELEIAQTVKAQEACEVMKSALSHLMQSCDSLDGLLREIPSSSQFKPLMLISAIRAGQTKLAYLLPNSMLEMSATLIASRLTRLQHALEQLVIQREALVVKEPGVIGGKKKVGRPKLTQAEKEAKHAERIAERETDAQIAAEQQEAEEKEEDNGKA